MALKIWVLQRPAHVGLNELRFQFIPAHVVDLYVQFFGELAASVPGLKFFFDDSASVDELALDSWIVDRGIA